MSGIGERVQEAMQRRFSRNSAPRRAFRALARGRKRLRRLWRAPAARLLAIAAPRGAIRDFRYFRMFERRGFHALPVHFYSPIPEVGALPERLWHAPSQTVGIDWNESGQLETLARIEAFKSEYTAFPTVKLDDRFRFSLANGSFGPIDAEVLYGMVRDVKPRRFLEIGSGHSTLLTAQALRLNESEGEKGDLTAIEPFPDDRLRTGFPGLSRVIAQPVQDVPLEEFTALGRNDVLFIDSSHVIKVGSDVQYEFLEVLPRLAAGVLVHVHDIFLPDEYPREWVVEQHRFFNEQYLLQAFLAFNRSFEIVWGGQYMCRNHTDAVRRAFPSAPTDRPPSAGSFWMRRIG